MKNLLFRNRSFICKTIKTYILNILKNKMFIMRHVCLHIVGCLKMPLWICLVYSIVWNASYIVIHGLIIHKRINLTWREKSNIDVLVSSGVILIAYIQRLRKMVISILLDDFSKILFEGKFIPSLMQFAYWVHRSTNNGAMMEKSKHFLLLR